MPDFSLTGASDYDPSLGLDATFGYRFQPLFSVEAEFEWMAEFCCSPDLEGRLLTANGRLYPLHGRLQPNLLVGLGAMNVESRESNQDVGFVMRFGGGIDFYVTESFVLYLDATYVLSEGDDRFVSALDYGSFGWGFRYRF